MPASSRPPPPHLQHVVPVAQPLPLAGLHGTRTRGWFEAARCVVVVQEGARGKGAGVQGRAECGRREGQAQAAAGAASWQERKAHQLGCACRPQLLLSPPCGRRTSQALQQHTPLRGVRAMHCREAHGHGRPVIRQLTPPLRTGGRPVRCNACMHARSFPARLEGVHVGRCLSTTLPRAWHRG